MRDKIFSNDYIGFTFNGIHSSQLGIVRTSDGSRFNENLLPTIQDKTVQVPGGDGTYYFGSYYTQKPFNISFAFDDLTEQEFAELKRWLGDKKVHSLIFDETPYKAYQAKVTGSATIKHIPFGATGTRIYKGEGSVQFTAYQPFARSTFKFFTKKEDGEYEPSFINQDEWIVASGIRTNPYYGSTEAGIEYDKFLTDLNKINLYNAGDMETHFALPLTFVDGKIPATKIYIDGDNTRQLSLKEITKASDSEDVYVKINTRLNIIEGYKSNHQKSGIVYNSAITEGVFFKIPQGESTLMIDRINKNLDYIGYTKQVEETGEAEKIAIEYDYYYF